jgi:type I site-specific restriction endonuclease
MGRRRRDGSYTPQKNNSIEDSVGNQENGYPLPDPNKTMINVTKEPSDAQKKNLKEDILEAITEKLMEKILDMVNQNVQDELKKFQDTKNKEHEMTQRQINELREDFNKHQSETKDTIKKEIYELNMTTQNIKELNKDMENLRKKN